MSYSNFLTTPWGQNHYPHFTNTELRFREGSGMPSVTHLVKWKNQGSNLCPSDSKVFLVYLIASMGFPRDSFPEAKKLSAKCRRCGFDPWVGKIRWRRKWQPTPWVVFLTGKSQGQRSLVGYSPWGRKRIGLNNNNIASLLKIYNFPRFFQQCGNYFFWA